MSHISRFCRCRICKEIQTLCRNVMLYGLGISMSDEFKMFSGFNDFNGFIKE